MYHHIVVLLLMSPHKWVSSERSEDERSNVLGRHFYDGNKIVLPLSTNASVQLLNHWINQAASGFMAAFASKRIKEVSHRNGEKFHNCSKEANSIAKHAKCVMNLLMLEKVQRNSTLAKFPQFKIRKLENKERKHERLKYPSSLKSALRKLDPRRIDQNRGYMQEKTNYVIGAFHVSRHKRSTTKTEWKFKRVNKDSYQLLTDRDVKTTFGVIVSGVKKILQKLKRRKTPKPWSATLADIQQLAVKVKEQDELLKKFGSEIEKDVVNSSHLKNALSDLRKKKREGKQQIRDSRAQLAATFSKLLRDTALLAAAISNKNISNFHNKTIRIASPRFFSILPDDDPQHTVNLLSPSVLSLHDEGKNVESKLSMSGLLGTLKLINEQDRNELLELISEASGLTDTVQQIHKKLETENNVRYAKGIDGQPLYFTKQNVSELYGKIESDKVDTFEKLYKALSKPQVEEMNVSGYAVLTKRQLKLIYGERSPYYHPIVLKRLSKLLDESDGLQKALENDLKKLAKSENFGLHTTKSHRRQKRFGLIFSPFLLQPLIFASQALSQPVLLSPAILSPVILSPAILGPFILNPSIFNPVILSPRILAPFILSPSIFSPLVLSPLALHPLILSPGIFNPVVLSPLALSPFILSPQVATPVILSPMILNPLLLNPMALSPLVFSPFVLSPIVYSPQYLSALFFSPYMLSPIIESELINTTVIMSPSILS
ncbi:unnamed protein product [Litomosoides sigmodontis]|uniref:Uncharacterized protein n=1 Tax=Litomosoides sigmodontis TaxID=42156 RepID=A0A3P6TVZ9_LITSI|nr:unnamed protein product [Litomosoides sigmodontis]